MLSLGLCALLPYLGCTPDEAPDAGGTVTLESQHNFSYSGVLHIPTVPTASGADLDICWDALTHDLQCHGLDPAVDIDNVALVRFRHFDHEEIADRMRSNSLQQADIDGYLEARNDGEATCTTLASMSFFGTDIDVTEEYVEGGGSYVLLMTSGTIPGAGARMITFLEPQAASENVAVDVGDGCDVLEFSVDLASLEPVEVLADGPWELDWSGITEDGQGSAIGMSDIDGVMLAAYDGLALDDLEEQFFDLEALAQRSWSLELSGGMTADLGEATDADGNLFGGFDSDGLWVLALRCSRCYNPAPLFLTVLEPVEGQL